MPDVLCLGELLIDFVATESGVTVGDASGFLKAPGGAPANVAVGLARLGISSGFLGKVGDDDFGRFLAGTLAQNGVDVSGLRFSEEARTALAFVSLRADGERSFVFFRHPSADMLYEPAEVDDEAIRGAKALHFGSITLIGEPSRSATLHAVSTARGAGKIITYDPNLRLALWPDAKAARDGMLLGWPLAHAVKVSREELEFLTGSSDVESAGRSLWHDDLRILLITDGAHGADYLTTHSTGHVDGFDVESIDTTGAGDGFMAGFVSRWLEDDSLLDEPGKIVEALRYANAVGALTTTRRGAIPALPTAEEVAQFLRT
jgi:fructokinase